MKGLLLILCLAATAAAEERDAESLAFLETSTGRESFYVGEPIRVRLFIGFDLGYLRTHLVQLFPRRMDLQIQVNAPWLDELPGAVAVPADGRGVDDGMTLVLNDDVVRLARTEDRTLDGRTCTVLEVARTFLATEPGTIELAPPEIRFAYATEFDADFLSGRQPRDRRDAVVRGRPISIEVRSLPEDGRPESFGGAVGSFTAEATAEPTRLGEGGTLKLTLRVEGEGNLRSFDTPRLDWLGGFHVYGALDDRGSPVRTIVYDLAPVGWAVTELPPIAFPFFDPTPPGSYRVATTRAIPLDVRVPEGASVTAGPPPDRPAPEAEVGGSSLLVPLLTGLVLAGLVAVALTRRSRGGRPVDPDRERSGEAAAAFGEGSELEGRELADAFAEFLAACLRCPAAAVVGPGLPGRLESAGVPEELARRSAELMERLVGARYGGEDTPEDAASARALVSELEAAFANAERA